MKSISNLYNLAATGILILVVLVFALPGVVCGRLNEVIAMSRQSPIVRNTMNS